MRRRIFSAVVIVAAVGFGLVTAQSANAAVVNCDDSTSPVTGNVVANVNVPSGSVCHIHGYKITGNITVNSNAKLFTRDGTVVTGNVNGLSAAQLNLDNHTEVKGNINESGTVSIHSLICGATVGGSVTLQNLSGGDFFVGQPTAPPPEGYTHQSADPDLDCTAPTSVGKGISIGANNVGRIKVAADTVSNSVIINNNTVQFENIKVQGNTIGGSLQCSGNTWTGFPATLAVTNDGVANSVGGSKTGQCANL